MALSTPPIVRLGNDKNAAVERGSFSAVQNVAVIAVQRYVPCWVPSGSGWCTLETSRMTRCMVRPCVARGFRRTGTKRFNPPGSPLFSAHSSDRCSPCPSCFAEIGQRAADGSREALAWMLSSLRTTSGVLARAIPHSVAMPNPLTYLPAASIRCLAPSTPSAACTSPR